MGSGGLPAIIFSDPYIMVIITFALDLTRKFTPDERFFPSFFFFSNGRVYYSRQQLAVPDEPRSDENLGAARAARYIPKSNRLSTPRHLRDRGSQRLTHRRGRFVPGVVETAVSRTVRERHAPIMRKGRDARELYCKPTQVDPRGRPLSRVNGVCHGFSGTGREKTVQQ